MIEIKKELWDLVFNSIEEGFCIIEMIFDTQEKPINYRFLAVNASFESQTGLSNVIGKCIREFAPNHEEYWFEIYGKVALTGESFRFENRAEHSVSWYNVTAFRFGEPRNFQVAVLFKDSGEHKRSEEKINQLVAIVDLSTDAIYSKSLDGIIQSWNMGAEKMFWIYYRRGCWSTYFPINSS